jgi:hypothetical protein
MIEQLQTFILNRNLTINLTKISNTMFFLFNENDICLKSDFGLSDDEIEDLLNWCRLNDMPAYKREGRKIIAKTNDY